MIDWKTLPLFIASILYILLAVRLMRLRYAQLDDEHTSGHLIGLFVVLATLLADEFFVQNKLLTEGQGYWALLITSLNLVLGPLTYLYASALCKRFSWSKVVLHLSPIMMFFILSICAQKIYPELQQDRLFLTFFSLLFLGSLLPYLMFTFALLKEYVDSIKAYFSSVQRHDVSWFKWWLYLITAMAILVCTSPFMPPLFWLDTHWLLFIFALLLSTKVDFIAPSAIAPLDTQVTVEKEALKGIEKVFTKIDSEVKKQKLYLRNGLTLNELANACVMTTHQVSQAINLIYHSNFYDYMNNLRIEESKRLLLRSPAQQVTTIAYESGFNSKSCFYSIFKQRVGCTPTEYRKKSALN
ncbi:helix-turn-helix domain-containing protein [Pseudoalteromonas piscicida]|uniref:helix-turn-helix domain-containing protein n=1 Tax=Pseudoalteromonas piscicida TaxID=43662 RepID=UPI0032C19559